MADAVGINPAAWTDPRMMLANQLMQQSTETGPLQSWTQVLARALSGPIGAYEATRVRDDRNQALMDVYNGGGGALGGAGGAQAAGGQSQPGLFQRIGNFITGDNSPSSNTSAAPQGGSSGPQTSGAPTNSQPSAPTTTGTPSNNPGIVTASYRGPSAAAGGPGNASGASVSQPAVTQAPAPAPTALAQQIYIARRMMQVGQERNQPDLVMQGSQMLQSINQEIAKAQMTAAAQGHNIDFLANNGQGQFSNTPGAVEANAALENAKARATELGKLDPSVTQGQIAQTNSVNTGTMGTAAAKAGAIAGSEAGARNASDLAYAGPLTTARDQAAANVAAANKPALDAAVTNAVNQANAGKPLTPMERNDQEQRVGDQFRNYEPVKEYVAASQGYNNVLAAAKGTDKASDINLIDGLVKMFNPGATVRQATFETFHQESQGIPDNIVGMIKSWYSNGQHLQPDTRAELLAQAQNRMEASRGTYQQLVGTVTQQAQSQGLNPKNIIPQYLDPLTAREIAIQRGLIPNPNAPQQPAPQPPAGQ